MRSYSNSTTMRLEGYARARGMNLAICISPDNSAGRYFVYNEDGKPLKYWFSLGWTVEEAKESISEDSWKFVVSEYAKGRI